MARKYLIDIQKKFKRLPAKGIFTRPKVILASKSKKSRLVGKVLKQYSGLFSTNDAVRIRERVKNYLATLNLAGIATHETKIVLNPTRNGKYQLCMIQPEIAQQNILSNYLKTCSAEEAISVFNQMIDNARKVTQFNKANSIKIGLDPKPANYAMVGGKVVQIDFYPPQINGVGKKDSTMITKHFRSRPLKIISKILKKPTQMITKDFINKRYNGEYLAINIRRHFMKARPELKRNWVN
ncbi:MAG: DUF6206 family protein [archaeon]